MQGSRVHASAQEQNPPAVQAFDPDNRVRFELMGLERVRIALVRGFDIPRGPMREDALDWVKEQEDRRERSQCIVTVSAIADAVGAWLATLILLSRLF
jgi:hypothetical protein